MKLKNLIINQPNNGILIRIKLQMQKKNFQKQEMPTQHWEMNKKEKYMILMDYLVMSKPRLERDKNNIGILINK